MKKILCTLIFALAIFSSSQSAQAAAVTLNFDSGTGVGASDAYGDLPDNYGGFYWESGSEQQTSVYNKDSWISMFLPGINYAATSGNFAIANDFADSPIGIISPGKTFSFLSANFASLVNETNSITITGYSGSDIITQTFDITNSASTSYNAGNNFVNISRLLISSNDNASIGMDDFTYTFDPYIPAGGGENPGPGPSTPAPEPASAILGLISLSGLLKRKRK